MDNSNNKRDKVLKRLAKGIVIPAHPLALRADRRLDETRQRALSRYYLEAGAGGLAVGVHTTQFNIRDPRHSIFDSVLALAEEEFDRAEMGGSEPLVRVAGICGDTRQAIREAEIARKRGFDFGLLCLSMMKGAALDRLIDHCRCVGEVIDLFGFYLQPAVGGIELPVEFWRRFCELDSLRAIKIAAFNRYHTIDVVRAVVESGRSDVALYTGNDDNIVVDLLTPFEFHYRGTKVAQRIVGGMLGQWAVWTRCAVDLLARCHEAVESQDNLDPDLLRVAVELTDANAAIFDAAHGFRGCIPGIHEVLRRHELLENVLCLDENEVLSPGQMDEIDRVWHAYPRLRDDAFTKSHLDGCLSGTKQLNT
jgi:hypothetical protein